MCLWPGVKYCFPLHPGIRTVSVVFMFLTDLFRVQFGDHLLFNLDLFIVQFGDHLLFNLDSFTVQFGDHLESFKVQIGDHLLSNLESFTVQFGDHLFSNLASFTVQFGIILCPIWGSFVVQFGIIYGPSWGSFVSQFEIICFPIWGSFTVQFGAQLWSCTKPLRDVHFKVYCIGQFLVQCIKFSTLTPGIRDRRKTASNYVTRETIDSCDTLHIMAGKGHCLQVKE